MRFVVPQFIEVEDKVVGPLTFKQAAYIIGAGGFALMLFTTVGFFWAIVLGSPVYALAGALAFVKINNRPFSLTLFSVFNYALRKKLYLWKKEAPQPKTQPAQQNTPETEQLQHLARERTTQSRLKELAWALDTQQHTS